MVIRGCWWRFRRLLLLERFQFISQHSNLLYELVGRVLHFRFEDLHETDDGPIEGLLGFDDFAVLLFAVVHALGGFVQLVLSKKREKG